MSCVRAQVHEREHACTERLDASARQFRSGFSDSFSSLVWLQSLRSITQHFSARKLQITPCTESCKSHLDCAIGGHRAEQSTNNTAVLFIAASVVVEHLEHHNLATNTVAVSFHVLWPRPLLFIGHHNRSAVQRLLQQKERTVVAHLMVR